MQWIDDPFEKEKWLIFDALVQSSKMIDSNVWKKISIAELMEFIDKLFEGKNE